MFERAFAAAGLPSPQSRLLAREVRCVYANPKYWRLYDDTLPVLTQLSGKGWTHLLLSNHIPELPTLLRHLQIDAFFAQVFNSAETGYEKPHPQAFQNVLDTIKPCETVWMIGDNPVADIAGAAAMGIPGILVRKRHADVRYQCDNLVQVAALLQASVA